MDGVRTSSSREMPRAEAPDDGFGVGLALGDGAGPSLQKGAWMAVLLPHMLFQSAHWYMPGISRHSFE